ncbi:hypothetical protein DEO72_LG10g1734 [Vigna unguiculata]|uniref:Uncharacterized protein n=1 Tax=Vigna unguiculata TaxID=3917 RepID=A0A4D6NCL2_VIGUN|nr:hypothetical protein DEO72_LG10g1734 [Vigna unguiculata]
MVAATEAAAANLIVKPPTTTAPSPWNLHQICNLGPPFHLARKRIFAFITHQKSRPSLQRKHANAAAATRVPAVTVSNHHASESRRSTELDHRAPLPPEPSANHRACTCNVHLHSNQQHLFEPSWQHHLLRKETTTTATAITILQRTHQIRPVTDLQRDH